MKITRLSAFTLIELLVVISIIAILASIAVPVFGKAQESAARTKALSNGKQIGLACKLFAQDHQGDYPKYKDPETKQGEAADANELFGTMFPDYISDEKLFEIAKSAYSKKNDGRTGGGQTLGNEENAWAYLTEMTDTSNGRWPLIVTAPTQGSKTYTNLESEKGGLWRGEYAIVIRCDISASADKTRREGGQDSKTSFIKRDDEPTKNALQFDDSSNPPWLRSDSKILYPK
jgi:prepilin-type N-terminal cleavage/methylation domain-containing protein